MRRELLRIALVLFAGSTILAAGCGTTYTTAPSNQAGAAQVYAPPESPSPRQQGVGIDSHDIVSMTDRMVRDMLAAPQLMNWTTPPRIVVDSEYFRNEGSARINRNLITDRLRVNLNRAANGKLTFIGRQYADMVEDERELERAGIVSGGTQGTTQQAAGWDYRLGGRIATLDKIIPATGSSERYYQITFELVERGSGAIIWSNIYEFEKFDSTDAIYR